jgi:hypothetical protein
MAADSAVSNLLVENPHTLPAESVLTELGGVAYAVTGIVAADRLHHSCQHSGDDGNVFSVQCALQL